MKQRRTPAEKKALAYKKDHITVGPGDIPYFRRSWPTRKARPHRAYRRQIHQLLSGLQQEAVTHEVGDPGTDAVRRKIGRKWHSTRPLGESLQARLQIRAGRALSHLFRQPYSSAVHRTQFAALLAEQVGRDTRYAREIAAYLRIISEPEVLRSNSGLYRTWQSWTEWLEAFFRDEPDWEPKVQAWIASISPEAE